MIYVDDMRMNSNVGELRGKWSHLFSDSSVKELDEFAEKLGLEPRWLQNTRGFYHYDIVEAKRQQAIKLGAKPIAWSDVTSYWNYDNEQKRYTFKNPEPDISSV